MTKNYISREAAIEALNKMLIEDAKTYPMSADAEEKEFNFGVYQGEAWAIKCVNALPSADVKPVVHGKWLTVENTMWCGGGYWKCSNCDQGFGFAAFFEADSWQFCPNCGADMREVQP